MTALQGRYFDGREALAHPVEVVFAGGQVTITGEEISAAFETRAVRVSPRIARTPRWLYLPDGGACVVDDSEFVDSVTRRHRFTSVLHTLESRPVYAVIAVALVACAMYFLVDRGVPAAVARILDYIPVEAEAALGHETLAGLDFYFMKPSTLPQPRQMALRAKFYQMVQASGETSRYQLVFRSSPVVGANAFALPSGILVMTDELVKAARNDHEILAVLAHELGHVRHRHAMRSLLEGSITAILIAGVTGDISATTSLAAGAPAVVLQNKFSRDNEREADRYAVDLLRRGGVDPRYFATLLKRLDAQAPQRGFPTFLSSHPTTDEREALAREAAGAGAGELKEDVAQTQKIPERPRATLTDSRQIALVRLLEERNYDELERVLRGYQFEFENDPKATQGLLRAFGAFEEIPTKAEPALQEWVEKKGSYAALVARGSFYTARGLDSRGTAYASNTTSENIKEMRRNFRLAKADLERSLPLTQKPFVNHRVLMTIARNQGNRSEIRKHYEEALRLAPAASGTRHEYMTSLEPRWGGSYSQMEAFVAESRAAVQDPKDFARLAARVPAYRGHEKLQARDFPTALKHYDEAVALNAAPGTLCERSYVLSQLGRNEEALRDATKGLTEARGHRYCRDMAASLARHAADPAEAIRITSLVLEVEPTSTRALNQRGYRYTETGKPDLAFRDYLASANGGDTWAQLQVGKSYLNGVGARKDRDEAVVWLTKAAAEGNAEARVLLSQAKAGGGR